MAGGRAFSVIAASLNYGVQHRSYAATLRHELVKSYNKKTEHVQGVGKTTIPFLREEVVRIIIPNLSGRLFRVDDKGKHFVHTLQQVVIVDYMPQGDGSSRRV